jgi:hypothetical protein
VGRCGRRGQISPGLLVQCVFSGFEGGLRVQNLLMSNRAILGKCL